MAVVKNIFSGARAAFYFGYYFIWRWLWLPITLRAALNSQAQTQTHGPASSHQIDTIHKMATMHKITRSHQKRFLTIDHNTKIYFELFNLCKKTSPQPTQTLVLLHGGLTSITAWFAQIPLLAAHYQLLCLDLRGQGRSSLGDKPFSYRLFATDLYQVLDHLNIENFHLAGWSDGGNAGLLTAMMSPGRLKSLVTIGSNYHYSGLNKTAKNDIQQDETFSHPWLARCLYTVESAHPNQWPELVKRTLALWRGYPKLTANDLKSVTVPTLIIVGQYDMISLEHAQSMSASLPNSALKIIAGRGHNLLFTEPTLMARSIHEFIQSHSSGHL